MQADFKKVQILLGAQKLKTKKVYELDVKHRWNIMFIMIDASYCLTDAFQSLSKMSELYSKILTLTSIKQMV